MDLEGIRTYCRCERKAHCSVLLSFHSTGIQADGIPYSILIYGT